MIHWRNGTDGGLQMALICHCAGVRESVIVSSIHEGARSIDDLRLLCGAAADCGGCEMSLLDLIDEHVAYEQRVALRMAS